jgi:uncharacterized integral membrane protein
VKDIVSNVTGGEQMNVKLILLIILASLAVIFLTQNVAAVEVTFLVWSISMSRALLIFFTLVIGFILGWSLHSYFSYRKAKNEALDIEKPKQSKQGDIK